MLGTMGFWEIMELFQVMQMLESDESVDMTGVLEKKKYWGRIC